METPQITVASGSQDFEAQVIATNPAHDLALIRPLINPFAHMPITFGGPGAKNFPQTKAKFATLAVIRAKDSDSIFACGYPFGESGLVTTMGTIASAWNTQVLLRAEAAGFGFPQQVYNVDLRINPGNSGGPIFRASDGVVVGVAVQSLGSLGIAVPAKFVGEFLTAQGVSWTPADKSSNRTPRPKAAPSH